MQASFKILSFVALFFLVSATLVSSAAAANQVGTYTLYDREVIAYANGARSAEVYGAYGWQYECVEYVNRFYEQALAHKNMKGTGNGNKYLGSATANGLTAYYNGQTTRLPCMGDIICSNNGEGHVAIVRQVLSDSIRVIHQNYANYPYYPNNEKANYMRLSLSRVNGMWKVGDFDSTHKVSGWLSKPIYLSVSPSSGRQGTRFIFTGSGYTPRGPIEYHVKYHSNSPFVRDSEFPVATYYASDSGRFSYTYQSSIFSSKGTYTIWTIDKATLRQSPTVYETIT